MKKILIALPESVAHALTRSAARHGVSRCALVSGLCAAYVERQPSNTDTGKSISNEIEQMFVEHADAQSPEYGERTVRHFNKDFNK